MRALRFAEYAKAWVALAVLLAGAVTEVIPNTTVKTVCRLVIAVGGVYAVWAVPNTDPPAPEPKDEWVEGAWGPYIADEWEDDERPF